MRRTRTAMWAALWLALSACGDDASNGDALARDAAASGDAGMCTHFVQQQRDALSGLSGTYRGTIADIDGDVACHIAGRAFELEIVYDSAAVCADRPWCAPMYSCDIGGTLRIDGQAGISVSGRVYSLPLLIMGVEILGGDALVDGGADPRLGYFGFKCEGHPGCARLGGVGGQIQLSWEHGAPDGGVDPSYELCSLVINEVP